MISYAKLWIFLENKGMKKTDLLNVISSPTLAKLGKNKNVNVEVIGQICDFLDCQPSDIMENISKKDVDMAKEIMFKAFEDMMKKLEKSTGKKSSKLWNDFLKNAPEMFPELLTDEDFEEVKQRIDKSIKDQNEE